MSETAKEHSMLDRRACWDLLTTATVGRLAVCINNQPEIFPINYVVDHGSVVFRTAAGTKLAATRLSTVAFEVDGYDGESGVAWSVVIKGDASEIHHAQELEFASALPLSSWFSPAGAHLVRLAPGLITGRRFVVAS
jgi:nitroimidazol reductase NimA-like FMN-containing flavoprotein (pyridoxamine 5'-phosphate oxidase superfamily)